MTEKKYSPLGFELRIGSVDPSLPLLFQIGVTDDVGVETKVIYVGMSRDGARGPFSNYDDNLRRMREGRSPRNGQGFRQIHTDIDIALREGKSIVIELVRNVDTERESLASARKALQQARGLGRQSGLRSVTLRSILPTDLPSNLGSDDPLSGNGEGAPIRVSDKLEAAISQLTQPVGRQYPRPWMTDLQDPVAATVFIVGMNQAKGYPVASVGSHARHLDALYNRNGQSCRALYDVITDGQPSKTRTNVDDLTRRLARAGVEGVLETNVICYSTPMSRDLALPEHAAGAVQGHLIFRTLLAHIRPAVLIAHGAGTAERLGRCLGFKLPSPPERADDVRSTVVDHEGHQMTVFVVPSLAPPKWNSWSPWAAVHLDLVANAVRNAMPPPYPAE